MTATQRLVLHLHCSHQPPAPQQTHLVFFVSHANIAGILVFFILIENFDACKLLKQYVTSQLHSSSFLLTATRWIEGAPCIPSSAPWRAPSKDGRQCDWHLRSSQCTPESQLDSAPSPFLNTRKCSTSHSFPDVNQFSVDVKWPSRASPALTEDRGRNDIVNMQKTQEIDHPMRSWVVTFPISQGGLAQDQEDNYPAWLIHPSGCSRCPSSSASSRMLHKRRLHPALPLHP